jgi:hypothetical protein
VKKGWFYTEKIVAVLLILSGLLGLFAIGAKYSDFLELKKSQWMPIYVNSWTFLKSNHFGIIISSLFIFSGIMLLMSKKVGWITAITLGIGYIYQFLKTLFELSNDGTSANTYVNIYYLIQLILLAALLQKPFRNKYLVTFKTWLIVILLLTFFISYPYWIKYLL